jgi:nicotinamidase-related amidase
LAGLEPRPNEAVFIRRGPSAFSSPGFSEAAHRLGGPLALAGFSLQDTVLATAFAAADRGLCVDAPLDCILAGGLSGPGAYRAFVRALEGAGPAIQLTTLNDLLQPEAGRLAAANTP